MLLLILWIATATASNASLEVMNVSKSNERNVTWFNAGELYRRHEYAHVYSFVDVNNVVREYNRLVILFDDAQDQVVLANKKSNQTKTDHKRRSILVDSAFFRLNEALHGAYDDLMFVHKTLGAEEVVQTSKNIPAVADRIVIRKGRRRQSMSSIYSLFKQEQFPKKNTTHKEKPKTKRQAELFDLISAGLSIYSLEQVQQMKADLTDEKKRTQYIATELAKERSVLVKIREHVEYLKDDLKWLDTRVDEMEFEQSIEIMTGFTAAVAQEIRSWAKAVTEMVVNKRLELRFFDTGHLEEAVHEIEKRAGSMGMKLLSERVNDLSEEAVSYVAENGRAFFVLHIPLAVGNKYDLYKYVNTPLSTLNGEVVRFWPRNEYIAINREMTEAAEFTESDLRHCIKRKSVYLCTNGLAFKNMLSTCTGALFAGEVPSIRKLCPVEIVHVVHEIVTIVQDMVLIISVPPLITTAYVNCPNSSSVRQTVQGMVLFRVPLECELSTPNFAYTAGKLKTMQIAFVARPLLNFTLDVNDIPMEGNVVKERHGKLAEVPHLDKDLLMRQHSYFNSTVLATIIVPAIIGLLVLMMVLYVVYKVKKAEMGRLRAQLRRRRNDGPRTNRKVETSTI